MKSGKRKCLFVFTMIMVITISVLLILSCRKRMEQAFSYEEFSVEEKEGCYKIENIEDYLKFAETVTDGNKYEWCEIRLNADLDFSDMEDVPIIGLDGEETLEFKGIFNGNGHTIRGLHMSNPSGEAGMFANLGGIVVNLRMEDCCFEGTVCGAITAKSMVNAVVINCDIDAKTSGETHGAIAGKFYGYIFNCVITEEQLAGELHTGWSEQCYIEREGKYFLIDSEDAGIDAKEVKNCLNAHLPRVSGFHEVYDLCQWKLDDGLKLDKEKAELLSSVAAKLYIHNEEIELKGYYSQNDDYWCIVIPAKYGSEEMTMITKTNKGNQLAFPRAENENVMLYTLGEYEYYIQFLTAENIDTLYIDLQNQKDLTYIHKNKYEEIPGMVTIMDQSGNIKKEVL